MHTGERPIWSSRAWAIAVTVLVSLLLVLLSTGAGGPAAIVTTAGIAVAAVAVTVWAMVRTRSQRRDYEHRLTTWAAERAAQAERLRIARDLHDLASHGIGLITVRAAATVTLPCPGGDAERVRALTDIEKAGRATTTELRRMLTVLRGPGDEAAPLRPAETLADLPGIVEGARAGGLAVTLDLPDLDDVSPGVQLTVCQVIREALANTARHAGPTLARASVHRDGDAVVVTVRDDGAVPGWTPHPGAGRGLTGLRERAAALNGTLHAEPIEGGFHLTVRLPDPVRP